MGDETPNSLQGGLFLNNRYPQFDFCGQRSAAEEQSLCEIGVSLVVVRSGLLY